MYIERNVSTILKQADLNKAQISSASQVQDNQKISLNQDQRRRVRKLSPGVAARVQALCFGKDLIKSDTRSHSNGKADRISGSQINKIKNNHRYNSNLSLNSPEESRRDCVELGKKDKPDGISTETIFDLNTDERASRYQNTLIPQTITSMADIKKALINSHGSDLHSHSNSYVIIENPYNINTLPEECDSTNQLSSSASKEVYSNKNTPDSKSLENSSNFSPSELQRSRSIHTISRVSFTSQLAQLIALQLPDAESIFTKISSISIPNDATKALAKVTEQIQSWVSQASEVITGLIGDDNVEWVAAGGREGLAEVDKSITQFEKFIELYMNAIRLLLSQTEVSNNPWEDLSKILSEVEKILSEWDKIKDTLKEVKNSVEIAMEWEELWNTVLGDIGVEMDVLKKLVFEMEERRHISSMGADTDAIGLVELETIVEETPPHKTNNKSTRSSSPIFSIQNLPEQLEIANDDTTLLSLFARMQPLRASLDFFPMRLSVFLSRARKIFPTACKELESRLMEIEIDWKKLEKDAESLRKELGEDRWILAFKAACRLAHNMYEPVERSFFDLRKVIDGDICKDNLARLLKRYEKTKMHYSPAIEKVLSIIDKGRQDLSTVNGEILRLHGEIRRKWETLKDQMKELSQVLEGIQLDGMNKQNRDFTSNLNNSNLVAISNLHATPGSSPASSIITTSQRSNLDVTCIGQTQSRSLSKLPQICGRRTSSLPVSSSHSTRRNIQSRFSTLGSSFASHSSPKQRSTTPTVNDLPKPSQSSGPDGKPRWNSSTKVQEGSIGHVYKSTSYTTPNSHSVSKKSANNSSHLSVGSKRLTYSPLGRNNELLSSPDVNLSDHVNSRLSLRDRLTERFFTPSRSLQQNHTASLPNYPQLHYRSSLPALDFRSEQKTQPRKGDITENTPSKSDKPVSSLRKNGRMSLLPLPKRRQ